jgi:hypothetical protein
MSVPWTWPPPIPSSASTPVSTDDVSNASTVAGATATDALNTLEGEITAVATSVSQLSSGGGGMPADVFAVDDTPDLLISPTGSVIRYPTEAAIVAQLAPLHWWNANHTVITGGLVDTITDIGSSPKNFTQVGAARAAVGVDGSGQNYLNFAGAQYYQAGVAADWTFASNGTACTYAYIFSRTALATTFELIFGTAANDTTKIGFDATWGFASASDQGPYFSVVGGTLNSYVTYTETAILGLNTIVAVIVRTFGNTPPPRTSNGVANTPIAVHQSANGQPRSWAPKNLAYNAGPAANTLTLGRRADLAAGQFLNARMYDVLIHNNAWSDAECDVFLQYARTRQSQTPQYGWPLSL